MGSGCLSTSAATAPPACRAQGRSSGRPSSTTTTAMARPDRPSWSAISSSLPAMAPMFSSSSPSTRQRGRRCGESRVLRGGWPTRRRRSSMWRGSPWSSVAGVSSSPPTPRRAARNAGGSAIPEATPTYRAPSPASAWRSSAQATTRRCSMPSPSTARGSSAKTGSPGSRPRPRRETPRRS